MPHRDTDMLQDKLYLSIVIWTLVTLVTEQRSCIKMDQESMTHTYNNCPNTKNMENPLALFRRDNKLHAVGTDETQNDQLADDIHQRAHSQINSKKSCTRPNRYLKSKRKLKGSKNHRKRLKKKKKYRKKNRRKL